MTQQHHLNHATWDCKYDVVFIRKYRKKAVFGKIKKNLGAVFHDLARRRECRIEEGHLMADHVHMLVSIPPKYSVAEVIGFIKGKGSIWIAQNIERKAKNSNGHKFWARGCREPGKQTSRWSTVVRHSRRRICCSAISALAPGGVWAYAEARP